MVCCLKKELGDNNVAGVCGTRRGCVRVKWCTITYEVNFFADPFAYITVALV